MRKVVIARVLFLQARSSIGVVAGSGWGWAKAERLWAKIAVYDKEGVMMDSCTRVLPSGVGQRGDNLSYGLYGLVLSWQVMRHNFSHSQ